MESDQRMLSSSQRGIIEDDTEFNSLAKGALAILFVACSFLVFNVGGYNSFVPIEMVPFVRLCIVFILLIPTVLLYRTEIKWNRYWKLSFSFFISSIGLLLAWFFGRWYLLIPGLSLSTVEGVAIAKLAEVLPIVIAILVGVWVVEKDFTPIYLRGGDVGKSLKMGLFASVAALLPFILVGGLGFSENPVLVLFWLPWMCIFAFSNAFMEELMIRGVFLKEYEFIYSQKESLVLTSIIFAVFHQAIIGYTDFISFSVFMGMTFFLGLIWGYVIQRSDNIWGSVFAHAVADILFILAVFGV